MTAMTMPAGIRSLLATGHVPTALVYDGFSAKLAEAAGFEALCMSGGGVSASRGLPDVGLVTFSEMLDALRQITYSVDVPVIADADTGYGNAVNVQRTVREYEQTGAAGLWLEDQEFPKKCGYLAGKRVIPIEEHANKVRAACDPRRDDDFVIIARTDALAVEGWDGVVERAQRYRSAGADLIFVDGIKAWNVDDYVKRLVAEGFPCVFNGGRGGILTSDQARDLGFTLHLASDGMGYEQRYRILCALRGREPGNFPPHLFDALGLQEIYAVEAKYTNREMPEATDIHLERGTYGELKGS